MTTHCNRLWARRRSSSNHQDNLSLPVINVAALMGISREKVSRQSRGPFPLQSAAIDHMMQLKLYIDRQSLSA